MSTFHKPVAKHKPVSWMLIAAILLVTILPAHYHLHHLYSDDMHNADAGITPASHAHTMDLHLLTDTAGQSHHEEDVTSIAASPDTVINKSAPLFSPIILLAVILALLPSLSKPVFIQPANRNIGFKKLYLYFSPLLRAPPLH